MSVWQNLYCQLEGGIDLIPGHGITAIFTLLDKPDTLQSFNIFVDVLVIAFEELSQCVDTRLRGRSCGVRIDISAGDRHLNIHGHTIAVLIRESLSINGAPRALTPQATN